MRKPELLYAAGIYSLSETAPQVLESFSFKQCGKSQEPTSKELFNFFGGTAAEGKIDFADQYNISSASHPFLCSDQVDGQTEW